MNPKLAAKKASPRERMILSALDLLRSSGLSGAGINHVVEASKTPKGSVYHYFPKGKHQLVAEALAEAERTVGNAIRAIFTRPVVASRKVELLFAETGHHVESSGYLRGCPVAAVTLDLDDASEELRDVCHRVFNTWIGIIAEGLTEIPAADRFALAEVILSTLEGSVILARTSGNTEPVRRSGQMLGNFIDLRAASKRSSRK